jgi:hypothetical protein
LGVVIARVLRTAGGLQTIEELEIQIAETFEALLQMKSNGGMPMLLLERAGLARMRGDLDGMKRDLAEARRLFADMGVTGWDDYARSIEA